MHNGNNSQLKGHVTRLLNHFEQADLYPIEAVPQRLVKCESRKLISWYSQIRKVARPPSMRLSTEEKLNSVRMWAYSSLRILLIHLDHDLDCNRNAAEVRSGKRPR